MTTQEKQFAGYVLKKAIQLGLEVPDVTWSLTLRWDEFSILESVDFEGCTEEELLDNLDEEGKPPK